MVLKQKCVVTGIRCVGKYVFENHLTNKTSFEIETVAGIKKIDLNIYSCEDLETLKGNVGKLVEAQTKLVEYRSDYILEKSNLISEIKELLK